MRDCEGCIWEDQCAGEEACDDYTPVEEDVAVQMELDRQAFWSSGGSMLGRNDGETQTEQFLLRRCLGCPSN